MTEDDEDEMVRQSPNHSATTLPTGTVVLVQSEDAFRAVDGKEYRTAWGPVDWKMAYDVLAIAPAGLGAFAVVGQGRRRVFIPINRVTGIAPCPKRPKGDEIWDAVGQPPRVPPKSRQH